MNTFPLFPEDHDAPRGKRSGKRGGLEPIPGYKGRRPCCHPSHQPPTMIVIPPGQQLRHVCPGCGAEVVLRGPDVTLSVA